MGDPYDVYLRQRVELEAEDQGDIFMSPYFYDYNSNDTVKVYEMLRWAASIPNITHFVKVCRGQSWCTLACALAIHLCIVCQHSRWMTHHTCECTSFLQCFKMHRSSGHTLAACKAVGLQIATPRASGLCRKARGNGTGMGAKGVQ